MRIPSEERGQSLAEYALILAIIAALVVVTLLFLGAQLDAILSNVGNLL